MSTGLNGSADQYQDAADEDTDATTVPIGEESAEGESSDLTTVIDDEDNAGAASSACQPEGFLIWLHGVDGAHKRAVEAIQRGDQISDACLSVSYASIARLAPDGSPMMK